MKDDTLSQALQSLPRERAREGFTDAVLARLPEGRPRRFPASGRLALAAALVLGIALTPLALHLRQSGPEAARLQPPARQAQIDQLRRERAELARELAELKALAEGDLPLVYLAGDEETDLVLDLEQLARRRSAGDVRPAVNRH